MLCSGHHVNVCLSGLTGCHFFCDSILQTIRNELLWSPEHSPDLSAARDVPRSSPSMHPCQRAKPQNVRGWTLAGTLKKVNPTTKTKTRTHWHLSHSHLSHRQLNWTLIDRLLELLPRRLAAPCSFGLCWCWRLLTFGHQNLFHKQTLACVWKSQKNTPEYADKKRSPPFLKWQEIPRLWEVWPSLAPPLFGFLLQVSG